MKEKLISTTVTLLAAPSAWAGTFGQVPEPSTLALFAAAAIAITVLNKLKK